VRVYVRLLGPTTHHKSLPALILCILRHALIQKDLKPWTVYLLNSDNMDGDHSWPYLFSR